MNTYGLQSEKRELEIMKAFNCNTSWPICLYDFTYNYRLCEFQVMRTNAKLSKFIYEDYFQFDDEYQDID